MEKIFAFDELFEIINNGVISPKVPIVRGETRVEVGAHMTRSFYWGVNTTDLPTARFEGTMKDGEFHIGMVVLGG